MSTALEIITSVLEELGVADPGHSLDPSDIDVCFRALNVLADAWLVEQHYAYTRATVSASLPAATRSLTIGTAQTLSCARPVRLETGCFVTVGDEDYALQVVSEPEYNAIQDKGMVGGWPTVCMYDTGSPTGNVYFWPTGACTVNLMVQTQASQFADISTSYTLPPGYQRAFKYTLIEEVATTFSRPVSPVQARNAMQARRLVKRANLIVPQLNVGGHAPIGIPEIR
jgi:hypothetical protein